MRATLALLLVASALPAAVLPGFRVQTVGTTAGFASSIAIDSRGTIYYTTTNGNLFRFLNGQSTLVSHVNTVAIGNSGLLGLALRDDNTAIVHYTTPGQVSDVLSAIDLVGGTETVMQSFVCDKDVPLRGSPAEHHGGNPSVASDGSIFVGIGDYGGRAIAALPEWNGGKIFRIHPDGSVEQFARGFRNPFDMVWDASKQRLIAPDNGDLADDEININGRNPYFKSGYLLGGFVTKSVYYIPDIDARPFPDPIALVWGADAGLLIDVAQTSGGDVYFVTPNAIKRLLPPQPGDCNGDGLVDAADIAALTQELADGNPHPTWTAQDGAFRGSWGCDVDQNGVIDSRDLAALLPMIRSRAVRAGGSPAAHP